MGHAKPDPFKQRTAGITPPPAHSVDPRDPDIYLATSPWQIMSYPYEMEQKRLILEELFLSAGLNSALPLLNPLLSAGLNSAIPSLLTDGKDYFYRNKMEYSLYWDNTDQTIKLAFNQRNSHRKVPFVQSSLERPEILEKAREIIADLNSRGEQARTYQSLMLRCDQQGTVSGGLLEKHKPHPTFPPLTDTLLGHSYTYSPNGFFQINLPVYELALLEIQPHITTDKVLDLYSGVGTIGLSVARDRDLTLVETNASAYAELVKNSADVKSATPVLAKSEDATSHITPDTTVIVDPPRAGLARSLVDALNTTKPPTIIYLSCNPQTQIRDLALLLENYNLTYIQPFNFFPRTPHTENLVVLTKK